MNANPFELFFGQVCCVCGSKATTATQDMMRRPDHSTGAYEYKGLGFKFYCIEHGRPSKTIDGDWGDNVS